MPASRPPTAFEELRPGAPPPRDADLPLLLRAVIIGSWRCEPEADECLFQQDDPTS